MEGLVRWGLDPPYVIDLEPQGYVAMFFNLPIPELLEAQVRLLTVYPLIVSVTESNNIVLR